LSKLFEKDSLALLPVSQLAKLFGSAGVDTRSSVVIYDEDDGQGAAMLAWTLEYLGQPDVRIFATFFEQWQDEGNEVYYKPVEAKPRTFRAKPNPKMRAVCQQLIDDKSAKLIDVRSQEEYLGRDKNEVRAGHIPGAINLPWTMLGKKNRAILSPSLRSVVSRLRLRRDDRVVTYCRSGPRAAIAYYAFRELGFKDVRVYDGSFHEWSQRSDLAVEENLRHPLV
jgi:thiosulfate/3-mercaptopyruvate sulfurtransferase